MAGLLRDNESAAHAVGLRYVEGVEPGIRRQRKGKGFVYLKPEGNSVSDKSTLSRIKSLVIPPAWDDVWICRDARGHIQAMGRDQRRRKQYLYHQEWRAVRDSAKFEHLLDFAAVLPQIRRRINKDLRSKKLSRERVLAAIVSILDQTAIRIGNKEYARSNKSFGLTTLRNPHVRVTGANIKILFKGKSGKHHEIEFADPRVARIVRRCQELPGQALFGYLDEVGAPHEISSDDVNSYLRAITEKDVTSKDFRTWSATLSAVSFLCRKKPKRTKTKKKRDVREALSRAAELLGNTPSVCKKSYVYPAVLEHYLEDRLHKAFLRHRKIPGTAGLSSEEKNLVSFLRATSVARKV